MKIVIIGLGTIGRTVLEALSGEGHTITIIDDKKEKIENLIEKYDVVTARAVAKLNILLELSIQAIKVNGYFIAMKSSIDEETKNIENYYSKLSIKEIDKIVFNLPKEDSLRTLLKYQKLDKTNIKYPRRYSEIKKKDI